MDNIHNNCLVNYRTLNAETKYIVSPSYSTYKSNERHQLADVSKFKIVKETSKLPQYSEVLIRSAQYGVKMEDLNMLQCDLEKLLSICVVRKCLLLSRLNLREQDKEIKKNQIYEYSKKRCYLNKSLEKNNLHSNLRNQNIFCNMKRNLPVTSSISYPPLALNFTAVNFLNNDTANNFWLFTEPYFGHITETDLAFIDELIQESRGDIRYRKTKIHKKIYSRCPRFHQLASKMHFHDIENANTAMEFKKKDSPENDQISSEIERCLTELASISNSNITELLKLRTQVAQHLYSL